MRSPRVAIRFVGAYFILCVLTLVAAFLLRGTPEVTGAVWIRGGILAVVAAVTLLVAVRAADGGGRGPLRLRIMAAAQVVAIVVLVVLPGLFPVWMRIEQVVCGLLLIGVIRAAAPATSRSPVG